MHIPENAKITKETLMYVCIEDEETKKYVTRTGYSYMLYLCLLLLVIGTMLRSQVSAQSLPWYLFTALSILGVVGLVAQLFLNNYLMKHVKIEVQNANRMGLVRVSGNKLSFQDPMTVTIIKVDPSEYASYFAKGTLVDVPEDDEEDWEDDEESEDEDYDDEEESGEADEKQPEGSPEDKNA